MMRIGWSNRVLFICCGIVALIIAGRVGVSDAQDNQAEQLTQLAEVVQTITSCNIQCSDDAEAQRLPYRQAALAACDSIEPKFTSTLFSTHRSLTEEYSSCLKQYADETALASIDNQEVICKDTCLVQAADTNGTGMSALAPLEFDGSQKDVIALCQMACFVNEEDTDFKTHCLIDNELESPSKEIQYCDALYDAHKSLCGRNCTNPPRYPNTTTVNVIPSGMRSQANALCYRNCTDQYTTENANSCISAIEEGVIDCPDENSWVGQWCMSSTSDYCRQLNQAGEQYCRFKCMSEHATAP